MKKIIFLLCFCFLLSPAFSMQDDAVKNEVRRVKLEAKQKVEQIKAEAKLAKIKAREDAKQAKIDAENAKINAVAEAKRAKKEAEFNARLEDIQTKNDAKKAEINTLAKAKKDKIDAELKARISKLDEKSKTKISALRAKYEGKGEENGGKKPKEKAVKAKKTNIKEVESNIKSAVNSKQAPVAQNEAETSAKTIRAVDLKPRAAEKKPVVYSGINFETKKVEIMDELKLSEKQRASAEKIYAKNKEEIININGQMEVLQNEMKAIKKADLDAKFKEKQLAAIEDKISALYQERDSVHNDAMKKFDSILEKEQKETWLTIKTKGARLFPDVEVMR